MLNAEASHAGKVAGMQLSILFDGEWRIAVMQELRAWLATRRAAGHATMTFEAFRHDAIAQPSTHKAWGSLAAIACREGLIAPMNHPDGSPVMRRAESVKTHAHPIRVWAIASSFSTSAAGETTATLQGTNRAELGNQTAADAVVGEGRRDHCEVRA